MLLNLMNLLQDYFIYFNIILASSNEVRISSNRLMMSNAQQQQQPNGVAQHPGPGAAPGGGAGGNRTAGDVLNDIGSMLADLTDELDAMLHMEREAGPGCPQASLTTPQPNVAPPPGGQQHHNHQPQQ